NGNNQVLSVQSLFVSGRTGAHAFDGDKVAAIFELGSKICLRRHIYRRRAAQRLEFNRKTRFLNFNARGRQNRVVRKVLRAANVTRKEVLEIAARCVLTSFLKIRGGVVAVPFEKIVVKRAHYVVE